MAGGNGRRQGQEAIATGKAYHRYTLPFATCHLLFATCPCHLTHELQVQHRQGLRPTGHPVGDEACHGPGRCAAQGLAGLLAKGRNTAFGKDHRWIRSMRTVNWCKPFRCATTKRCGPTSSAWSRVKRTCCGRAVPCTCARPAAPPAGPSTSRSPRKASRTTSIVLVVPCSRTWHTAETPISWTAR